MKVKNLMSRDVQSCAPGTSVRRAIRTMREIDSGVLPVVEQGRLIRVITDRDICLALAERDCSASEMTVAQSMSRTVHFARDEEGAHQALARMRQWRVRRLPVINADERLVGILSMNDIILHAEPLGDGQAVCYEDAVRTLKRICEHRYPIQPPGLADVTELAHSL